MCIWPCGIVVCLGRFCTPEAVGGVVGLPTMSHLGCKIIIIIMWPEHVKRCQKTKRATCRSPFQLVQLYEYDESSVIANIGPGGLHQLKAASIEP
jgi:hypothetical protein